MKSKNTKKINWILFFTTIIMISLFAGELWARAGGGGGGGGGSGGDGGGGILDIFNLIFLVLTLPAPWNIVAIVAICVVIYYMYKSQKEKTYARNIDWDKQIGNPKGYKQFKKLNPNFDEKKFIEKVATSFTEIQKAWAAKDLGPVRKWLSDGVYQRFNVQVNMMNLLGQTNTLENFTIKKVQIDSVETDGQYDIINVAIRATITDKFISTLYPSLNSGGKEEFVEYWGFIKKRGSAEKDTYNDNSCPNCSAPLPAAGLGELCKCEACGSIINSGEFDWVLAEITQADDYQAKNPKLNTPGFNEKVRKLISENADFSVQMVEDKASNGYLQMMMAIALKNPSMMRRFVNDKVLEIAKSSFTKDTSLLYNRLYLNDVSLIAVFDQNEKNVLVFSIKSTYQRVYLSNGKVVHKDRALFSQTEIIFMSRDEETVSSENSIYSHSCPNCGGPVENTLDVNCPYCGGVLNSTSYDWIISDYMTLMQYQTYRREHKNEFVYNIDPVAVDKLVNVRDFALNNVLVMIGIDGVFDEREEDFARQLAKKWGYNPDQLTSFMNMAKNHSLSVRMPGDPKAQKRILKLMHKAAMADDVMDPAEKNLLDEVKTRYNIPA